MLDRLFWGQTVHAVWDSDIIALLISRTDAKQTQQEGRATLVEDRAAL